MLGHRQEVRLLECSSPKGPQDDLSTPESPLGKEVMKRSGESPPRGIAHQYLAHCTHPGALPKFQSDLHSDSFRDQISLQALY